MSDEMTRGNSATGATLACAAGVTPERLSAWRDGLLTADQAEWLATHAADCAACGERMRDYDQIGVALRAQIIPSSGVDPWPAMRQRIARERRGLRLAGAPAWGGWGALVAATLLIALFAGLLARQATLRPAGGATPTPGALATPTAERFGVWTQIAAYRGLSGLAIAPANPRVAYQFSPGDARSGRSTFTLRRTDDQGATWTTLAPPLIPNAASYPVIGLRSGIAVSPFDARVVYLYFSAEMDKPDATCMLNAGGQPGLCAYQFISTDSGATWLPLALPGAGDLTQLSGQRDMSAQPSATRLYGIVNLPEHQSGRLVRSDDGGVTWRPIDAPIVAAAQSVTDYAATPTGSMIFALSNPATPDPTVPYQPLLWRSDDAGATWVRLGPAPNNGVTGLLAAIDPSSGAAILYQQSVDSGGNGVIQGSPNGNGGWWQGAPSLDASPTGAAGADMLATLPDGSLLIDYKGRLWTWKWAKIQPANLGWSDAGPSAQLDTHYQVFTQTLPDGSLRLWVSGSNSGDASTVEYTTLKP